MPICQCYRILFALKHRCKQLRVTVRSNNRNESGFTDIEIKKQLTPPRDTKQIFHNERGVRVRKSSGWCFVVSANCAYFLASFFLDDFLAAAFLVEAFLGAAFLAAGLWVTVTGMEFFPSI